MQETTALFDSLATIVTYPTVMYVDTARRSRKLMRNAESTPGAAAELLRDAGAHLDAFIEHVAPLALGELEELFTRTFDINPVSSLELGWHLFGETYERGSFLVKMRAVLRQLNIQESTELPDHLSFVLAAFGRMDEPEAAAYATDCLFPALRKMLEGFADQSNPYEHVLRAVQSVAAARQSVMEGAPRNV